MNTAGPPEQQGIQSVEVGVRLLRALAEVSEPMSLKSLAEAAQMPASKAHRYLVSLLRTGLVEQNSVSSRYDLGPLALDIGLAALGRLDVVRHATVALGELRSQLDETCALAVWGRGGSTIIRFEESSHPVTLNVRVGWVLPLLASATGRVFAAYLPANMTDDLITPELAHVKARRGSSILRTRKDVERLLTEVRRRGMARVVGDLLPGVSAMSAPVFTYQKGIAAVLTVFGRQEVFDANWDGLNAQTLRTIAGNLSRRLGYAG